MAKDKKIKKKSRTGIIFLAATIITTVAIIETIKECRRKKEEKELLSYEVW